MAAFDVAVTFVLANEGGFVDDANDAGGATNFGISARFLAGLPVDNLQKYGIYSSPISRETVQNLTIVQAKAIYKGEFWDHADFADIVSPYLANYIFDMCVNHGIEEGIKLTQRALWAVYGKIDVVLDDGVLGEQTLKVLNVCDPHVMESVLMAERAGYVRLLVARDSKDGGFLHGWLERCYRI